MKCRLAILFALLLLAAPLVQAQTSTQSVTIVIRPANILSVSNERIVMIESPSQRLVDGSGTYEVTSTDAGKLVASLGGGQANGTPLALNVEAPRSGRSAGRMWLSETSRDVVTGLVAAEEGDLRMSYTGELPVSAGKTRVVVLTIIE